jgi:hypothetical protein
MIERSSKEKSKPQRSSNVFPANEIWFEKSAQKELVNFLGVKD